jgi:hypothetical protein
VTTDRASGAQGGAAAERVGGPAFKEALGQAQAIQGQAGTAAVGGDPIHALAQQVKAGQLSVDQAIEHLVERAASGVGRHLSSVERDELREVVRQAISFDPTLSALRSER